MKKIRYNNNDIYIDDSPIDPKETGIIDKINVYDDLDKTMELKPILNKNSLEDTLIDLWGKNE